MTRLFEKTNQACLNKKTSEGEIHCIVIGFRQMKGPVATLFPQCCYLDNDADLNQTGVGSFWHKCVECLSFLPPSQLRPIMEHKGKNDCDEFSAVSLHVIKHMYFSQQAYLVRIMG